jgi:hypothetical protein
MVFSTDAWDKRGEVHTDAALAVALGIAGTCSRNDAMMTAPEVRALSLSSLCQGCIRCFSHSFAAVQGLHYGAVTDVAWSPDASFLLMSSLDGFLSLVWFERETELGKFFEESGELQTGSRSSPSTPLTTGSCSLDGGQGSHRSADPVMRCNREQPIASTLVSSDADSGHGRNTDHSTKVGEHAVSSTT